MVNKAPTPFIVAVGRWLRSTLSNNPFTSLSPLPLCPPSLSFLLPSFFSTLIFSLAVVYPIHRLSAVPASPFRPHKHPLALKLHKAFVVGPTALCLWVVSVLFSDIICPDLNQGKPLNTPMALEPHQLDPAKELPFPRSSFYVHRPSIFQFLNTPCTVYNTTYYYFPT